MPYALTFDTLAFAKRLQSAGVTSKVAEAHAEALAEVIEDNIATRRDLKELELNLKREIKTSEMNLTLRMGGIMGAGIAILAFIFQYAK